MGGFHGVETRSSGWQRVHLLEPPHRQEELALSPGAVPEFGVFGGAAGRGVLQLLPQRKPLAAGAVRLWGPPEAEPPE